MAKHSAFLIPLLITIFMAVVSSNLNWGGDNWQSIVEADGKGYYAYLPAVFIYHDLNYGFFDEIENGKYHSINRYYDYRVGIDGRLTNKYFVGTALAELPFFLLAHLYCKVGGAHPADGYSKPYTVVVSVAALFYLLVGLFFIAQTAQTFEVGSIAVFIGLATITFGTNLFYYTVGEPGMSHIYSFAVIAAFVFFSRKFFISNDKGLLPVLGFVLGFIALIRPVNLLVIAAIPFVAGSMDVLKNAVRSVWKNLAWSLSAIVLFTATVMVQLIIYRISTEHWLVYSYAEEGFNFFDPQMLDMLFSYKKGLFLYTPVFLIMLASGIWAWRSDRFRSVSFLGFFLVVTYVLSSWWNWWYGGSFSSRVFIDFIPLIVLPFLVFLHKIHGNRFKYGFYAVLLLLVGLCQLQTYQYRYYIIHWENMTKEKYWERFLKLEKVDPSIDSDAS